MFRAILAACLASTVIAEACVGDDGVCEAPAATPQKEQVLLQVNKLTRKGDCSSVSRRRRHQDMMSCRRRHSSPGSPDTDSPGDSWKCDEQANRMLCEADLSSNAPVNPVSPNPDLGSNAPVSPVSPNPVPGGIVGFPSTNLKKAAGLWCEVDIPAENWNLKSCPSSGNTPVKVLTYNLFWWNLFKRHDGGDRSAGRLMSRTGSDVEYDVMGFQECEDVNRVLADAGMSDEYTTIDGGSAIAIAFRKTRWTLLGQGSEFVGEDSKDQYYGKRRAQWVRLQNGEGKIVFFVNHHGPLRVSQGSGCTGSSTALNIMRVIAQNAQQGDVIVLVGDFNAEPNSSRIIEMNKRLNHVFAGTSMGGVDHVFSNCPDRAVGENLGKGDGPHTSDHDALAVTLRI